MSTPPNSTERPDVAAQIDPLNDVMNDLVGNVLARILMNVVLDLSFLAALDTDRDQTDAINAALAEHGCPIRLVWLDPTPDAATEVL